MTKTETKFEIQPENLKIKANSKQIHAILVYNSASQMSHFYGTFFVDVISTAFVAGHINCKVENP